MLYHPFKRIAVLIYILSLLHPCLLFRYFQCLEDDMELESNSTSTTSNLPTEIIENHHLPQRDCSIPRQAFKLKINLYEDIVECDTPVKIFKSGCLRCSACLAIAQQIEEAIEEIEIGNSDPNSEIENIKDTLSSVCTNGFKEFDLRRYNGHIVLMKATSSSSHVSSKMNGKWQSKLREICSRYLENINMMIFYSILMQNSHEIEDYLCRGDGVFRECYNINFKQDPSVEEDCQLEMPDFGFMFNGH